MTAITAAQVRALREKTDLPMMECKQALTECGGDEQAAVEWLKKKYKGKMEARADRATGEGRVCVYIDDARRIGGIVDLRCETAPVARNELFVGLGERIARQVAAQDNPKPPPDAVLATESLTDPGKTVGDLITDVYGRIRENIRLEACRKVTGEYLCSYVHHDGKKGVLIALDAVPANDAVGLDLCQHVTFTQPMAVTRDQIPAEEIEKVRAMARQVAEAEGKPPQIIDKIVQGKANAFCSANALMDQEHVKPEYGKQRVRDVLKAAGVSAVLDLAYMRIGG